MYKGFDNESEVFDMQKAVTHYSLTAQVKVSPLLLSIPVTQDDMNKVDSVSWWTWVYTIKIRKGENAVMKRAKNKIVDEQGAIVVEATISLTAFMFFIVTILSIVNICYAQAKIGVAVNTTAKEISEYSYLYELTGLRVKQSELYEEGQDAKEKVDNALDGVVTIFDAVNDLSDNASSFSLDNIDTVFEEMSGNLDDIESGTDSVKESFDAVAEDPKAFALGIAALAGNEVTEIAKSKLIAAPLSKALCQKHLTLDDGLSGEEAKAACNEFLKKLNIEPVGDSYIDGLDFGDSVFFLNGSTDIMVVVHYKIKVLELLGNDITLSFTQCGTTRGWVPVTDREE